MLTFTLTKPITVNGASITELNCDCDALSLPDIKNARKVRAFLVDDDIKSTKSMSAANLAPRLDEYLRIGLMWVAAMKTDKRLTLNDVLQLSAKDALTLSEQGIDYLF